MPGVIVTSLAPDGQAEKLGICVNEVLLKYNDTLLNNADELNDAIQCGNAENRLIGVFNGEVKRYNVQLGKLGVVTIPYLQPNGDEVQVNDVLDLISKSEIASIKLTTVPQLEGYRVIETIEIVTAEYVGGMNIFRDLFSSLSDIFGGRSGTLQNELRKARVTCLFALKKEAHILGANAVIGVDLDYSEISGGGKSMLFLVASGTAVIVEKIKC